LLEAKSITKRFGAKTVLDHASFSVRDSEILGLIGPNGAGKTTLFECLAGLMPSEGEVTYRGSPIAPPRRKDVLFYLPDAIRPWPDQRLSWLLQFFETTYQRDASELIAALKLEPFWQSRMGSLSKGELKRALLAIGLLSPRPLLLLDEPFDGLDFRQTRDVMQLLRSQSRTLFLSIHQLNDASRVCDRLVLLSAGRVVGIGTLEELKAQSHVADGGLEEIFLALT
jgi:ABC-2 type transport system ATP-binding protein